MIQGMGKGAVAAAAERAEVVHSSMSTGGAGAAGGLLSQEKIQLKQQLQQNLVNY